MRHHRDTGSRGAKIFSYKAAKRKKKLYKRIKAGFYVLLGVGLFLICGLVAGERNTSDSKQDVTQTGDIGNTSHATEEVLTDNLWFEALPAYAGEPYVVIDDNIPDFSDVQDMLEEGAIIACERYSGLDALGRCGVAVALLGQELMPTQERGEIGEIRPSGWHTVKYDCIEDRYLYNRCHLIGYQLSGENANERNLITGTRYMNIQGMLPIENKVARYIRNTGNHVWYRVTPVFQEENLVAAGVRMEAYSVEDDGAGICFDVFVYNVQPGVVIDYATGDSWAE